MQRRRKQVDILISTNQTLQILHLKHQVYKISEIIMDKKPTKSTKIDPHKNKQPYDTLLNTSNKITCLITGQQAPGWVLDTCFHVHYLEYITKGHIAMHTILF